MQLHYNMNAPNSSPRYLTVLAFTHAPYPLPLTCRTNENKTIIIWKEEFNWIFMINAVWLIFSRLFQPSFCSFRCAVMHFSYSPVPFRLSLSLCFHVGTWYSASLKNNTDSECSLILYIQLCMYETINIGTTICCNIENIVKRGDGSRWWWCCHLPLFQCNIQNEFFSYNINWINPHSCHSPTIAQKFNFEKYCQ